MRSEADREMTFSRRALLLGASMGAVGVALAGRMTYLSVFEQQKYDLLAEDNRVSVRLIPPRRGWIVDRRGKPLALNRPDYRIEIVPEQVQDVDATLAAIGQVIPLTSEDIARIKGDIDRLPSYMPIEVAKDIPWEQFAAINVRLPELAGVQPIRGFSRLYPDGAAVGHLLGYVGAPTREQYKEEKDPLLIFPGFKLGKDGIERMLEDELRGKAGARRVEVNARGRILRDLDTLPDTPGKTVKLTIDRDLQAFAARRIGEQSASVIVMDCWTGDLLCMISMPAFDPNSFSDGISHTEWNAHTDDERHPLINKTVQGTYPPGSTFKMITALAILEAGFEPHQGVHCSGSWYLGNHRFSCWRRGGHGGVNMLSGIFQSCDTYFYHFGRMIGAERIANMARKFGFGSKFDLPLPTQRKGIVPDAAWKRERYDAKWLPGETINYSIGQGYLNVTPLQLAVMAARIASGRVVTPRLIDDGSAVHAPLLDVPAEHLAVIRQGMNDVINSNRGTAIGARLRTDAVQMAGKTGTAQVRRITAAERARGGSFGGMGVPWKYRDHALFVAYAPVENPRYAASVIVEHGISGSQAAAPIARDVMTYLFEPQTAMRTLESIEADWAEKKAELAAKLGLPAVPSAAPFPILPPVTG